MEAWNETIKAALLGTGRNSWNEDPLPAAVKEIFTRVKVNEADREETFLKAASLMMNYAEAGKITSALSPDETTGASADARPACSRKSADLFITTITEGRGDLTSLWLHTCNKQGKRAPHWLLPELLDLGASNRHLQGTIIDIGDARGQWLAHFNPAWKYALSPNADEVWSTGKFAERQQLLEHLRRHDPAKARELLSSTWKQENATHRADFLKLFREDLSEDDIPFLEELLNDKSQKVRSEANYMLRSLPGSSINNMAWGKLSGYIELKKRKQGASEINLKKISPEDKELLLPGAERESEATVPLKDDERWHYHMISVIEPKRWEEHFTLPANEIIGLFLQAKKTQKLLPAFSLAAHRSHNLEWAKALLNAKVMANSIPLMLLLPLRERESIYREIMEDDISVVNNAFTDEPSHQWSLDFTRYVVKAASSDAYRYRREWYRTTTVHFHIDILKELDKFGPSDMAMKSFWQGISQEIVQTIELREAITHSLK